VKILIVVRNIALRGFRLSASITRMASWRARLHAKERARNAQTRDKTGAIIHFRGSFDIKQWHQRLLREVRDFSAVSFLMEEDEKSKRA